MKVEFVLVQGQETWAVHHGAAVAVKEELLH